MGWGASFRCVTFVFFFSEEPSSVQCFDIPRRRCNILDWGFRHQKSEHNVSILLLQWLID